jgi:hypothetical protein
MIQLFVRRLAAAGAALACLTAPVAGLAQAQATPSPSPSVTESQQPVVVPVASPAPASTPARRALPQPFDPLFPSGGEFLGPTIGVPTAAGVRVYGWIDPGLEISTSQQSNYPLTYNDVPNQPQLDQFVRPDRSFRLGLPAQ